MRGKGVGARHRVLIAMAGLALLVAGGWPSRAGAAGSITGLQVTATTQAAKATQITDTVTFTAPDAIPASGYIQLTAPTGSTFSTDQSLYSVQAGSGSPVGAAVTFGPGGAGANVVRIQPNAAVDAGQVTVVVRDVADPIAEEDDATFSALTSADATPPTPVAFKIGPPTQSTGVSATAAVSSAGAEETATISMTPNGALARSDGYIELAAPAGSTFSSTAYDYEIEAPDGTISGYAAGVVTDPGGLGSNVVDIYTYEAIAAGSPIRILAFHFANPSAAVDADHGGTMTVSTSSDAVATTTPFAIGTPTEISGLSVTPNVTAAGAHNVHLVVDLTSPSAMTDCAAVDPYCSLEGYGTVDLRAPEGSDLGIGDATFVTDVTSGQSATSTGISVYPTSDHDAADVGVPFPVAAGDHLRIDIYESANAGDPVPDGQFSVSTSVDTAASSLSYPITAATVATHVSTSVASGSGGSSTITAHLTTVNPLVGCPDQLSSDCQADNTGYLDLPPQGFVKLTVPEGTTLPSDVHDYTLTDADSGATQTAYVVLNVNGAGDNVAQIYPTGAVAAGDALTVSVDDVTDLPSDPAIEPTTSSDVVDPYDLGDPPTGVTADSGDQSVTLHWTAPATPSGATLVGYRVIPYHYGTAQTAFDTGSTDNHATVGGLTNGEEYTFRVAGLYQIDGMTERGPLSEETNGTLPEPGSGSQPPQVALSTGTVDFGSVIIGQAAAPQTLMVSNTGTEDLSVDTVALGGANAGDFSIRSDGCSGQTVAGGASCPITLGFTPTAADVRTASLTLTDDASDSPQEVTLTGIGDNGPSLSGTVTDGTVSPNAPVSGADVSVCPQGGSAGACVDATTDSSGHYSTTGLTAGTYTVHVQPPDRRLLDATAEVTITSGPAIKNFTLAARPLGDVTGTVTIKTAIPPSLPVAGNDVRLCAPGQTLGSCLTTTTDAAGHYNFAEVDPGSYVVSVVAPSPGLQNAQASITVTAFATTTQDLALVPLAPGAITGVVTTAADDVPVSGADVVSCEDGAAPAGDPGEGVCHYATTGSDGRYVLAGLEPGDHLLQVFAANDLLSASAEVDVPTGTIAEDFSLTKAAVFPAGVTLTSFGFKAVDGLPFLYYSSPFALSLSPDFPSEPAGTQLVYLATVSLTRTGQTEETTLNSGTGVFHVVYGSGGQATVTEQYADTDSGPTPTLVYSSDTAASAVAGSDSTTGGIVVQYDPTTNAIVGDVPPVNQTVDGDVVRITINRSYAVVISPEHSARATAVAKTPPKPKCTVPNVVGQSQASAESAIRAANCSVGTISLSVSTQTPGTVLSTSPVAGKVFAAGKAVTLHVAEAKPKKKTSGGSTGTGSKGSGSNGSGSTGSGSKGNGTGNGNGPGGGSCNLALQVKGKTILIKLHGSGGGGGGGGNCGSPSGSPSKGSPPNGSPPNGSPPKGNPPKDSPPTTDLPPNTGDAYVDPSGTVRSKTGIPLQNATVTLLTATTSVGGFAAVPNGSVVMSPANRSNPDHTSALGAFGWDTLPGFYRVQASHPGCSPAITPVAQVPPPVTNIAIALTCPHLTRHASRLSLKIRQVRGGSQIVTAHVRGRRPQGELRFSTQGLTVTLPLNPKTASASFVLPQGTRRVRASYSGDADNKPSARSARVPR